MANGHIRPHSQGSVIDSNVNRPRTAKDIIDIAEQIIKTQSAVVPPGDVCELVRQLIAIYASPHYAGRSREIAAKATAMLAGQCEAALDEVLANAAECAARPVKDDPGPDHPNSFSVLSAVPASRKVVAFLLDMIKTHCGSARWKAIATLHLLDPTEAGIILHQMKLSPEDVCFVEDMVMAYEAESGFLH